MNQSKVSPFLPRLPARLNSCIILPENQASSSGVLFTIFLFSSLEAFHSLFPILAIAEHVISLLEPKELNYHLHRMLLVYINMYGCMENYRQVYKNFRMISRCWFFLYLLTISELFEFLKISMYNFPPNNHKIDDR